MQWIKKLLPRFNRNESAANKLLKKSLQDANKLLKKLSSETEDLRQLHEDVLFRESEIQFLAENSKKVVQDLRTSLEALRSENKILSDVEVPILMDALHYFKEQWKEMSAASIAKQVAVTKEQ